MFSDDREYYYVKYRGQGVDGCLIIPQMKHPSGGENPDGMNIAEAHRLLHAMFHRPVLVENWRQVSRRRAEEFEIFVGQVMGSQTGAPEKRAGHLSLVPQEPPAPKGDS